MDLEYCPYCMSPVKPGEPCGTCMLTAGSYTPAARHLPPGTVLQGRYLVGRVLGEGGFGITYIGRDLVLGLKVAVKEYFPADKATRDASVSMEVSSYMGNSSSLYLRGKDNFLREAQTIARLDRQPNIVSVKDFFEANNTAYIVMEYIDGTTFKELVDQRGGKLPAWELLHLIEPMFGALSAMHALGLIHRDISPENLMLEQGTVRLLDFGCARESANGDATITIMLRHGYAPLEQYQSSRDGQGPWTDIYALSATIYYCITGKKPPQAMDRLLEDELTPPRKLGIDLSERQEKALLKGLSVHPRTRFQSAEEFHTALYTGREEEMVTPPEEKINPPEEPEAPAEEVMEPQEKEIHWTQRKDKLLAWLKARKKALGIAALLAVALLAVVIAGTWHGSDSTDGNTAADGENKEQNSVSVSDNGELAGAPAYVYNGDFDRFEELMSDGSVAAIIISEGSGMDISRPIEITKPVQMEPSTQLHVNAEVTLSSTLYVPEYSDLYNNDRLTIVGEGRLEVDGYYGADGLLRTIDGGSILIGDTGYADFSTLWLAQDSDLEADSGHIGLDQSRYIVADENVLFTNAVHVSSFEELENAVNDRRTDAITIDSSIEMVYALTINKPLLIMEDAMLATRLRENAVILGNVVVNRGRLDGEIQFNDGGVCLNYGASDMALDAGGGSCILNLGEIRFLWGNDRYSAIVNMGHMSLEGDGEDNTLNIIGGGVMNYGDIDLVFGHLQIRANGYFSNHGTVRISANADIGNTGHLWTDNGQLILEGILNNNEGVLSFSRIDSLDFQGGSVEGGMILAREDRSRLEDNENIHYAAIVMDRDPADTRADVDSAWELQSMENSGRQSLTLHIPGDVVVEGDLTLTHDLIVGGTLEVTGCLTMDGGVLQNFGTLTVGGLELRNNACLRQSGRLLRLNGGTLALYDSEAVISSEIDLGGGQLLLNNTRFFSENTIRNIGGVRVDEEEYSGSYLYNRNNMELLKGAGLDVGAGMFTSNWMDIGGNVTVSRGGALNFMNGLRLYNEAVVTVAAEGSRFNVYMNGLQMDGGTRIVNDGLTNLDGWEMGFFNLDGEIINGSDGHFSLCGEPVINGVFRNEGAVDVHWGTLYIWGEFNNLGTATSRGDAGFQGNWTGSGLEYREE